MMSTFIEMGINGGLPAAAVGLDFGGGSILAALALGAVAGVCWVVARVAAEPRQRQPEAGPTAERRDFRAAA